MTVLEQHLDEYLQLRRTLASCDRSTLDGVRDHAMLLLLARLGVTSSVTRTDTCPGS